VPRVGVPFLGTRGKVGRVGDDPVEAAEPSGEIGPDGLQVEMFGARDRREPTERVGVAVRRDDARPPSGRGECDLARAGSDLEERRSGGDPSER